MQKSILLFLFLHLIVSAQEPNAEAGEFKMVFPGIYFKHQSTDYAVMPYTIDSCLKYITFHLKDINELVLWRDFEETEELTTMRIKKLKMDFHACAPTEKIKIRPMGKEQKISRHVINKSISSEQMNYLLSLNSVFEICETRFSKEWKQKNHIEQPRIWCGSCWKNGFHIVARRKLHKMKKRKKQATKN
jgi:hypothetical protein